MPSDAAQKIADHNARVHAATACDARSLSQTEPDHAQHTDGDGDLVSHGEREPEWKPHRLGEPAARELAGGERDGGGAAGACAGVGAREDLTPAVAARIAADALLRETTAERDALRAENEDRLSTVTDLLCNHADLLREVGGSLNDIAETERAVEWLCAFRRGEG